MLRLDAPLRRIGTLVAESPTLTVAFRGKDESGLDWGAWVRRIERKRRQSGGRVLPANYFVRATYTSFALAEMNVSTGQVAEAVAASSSRRTFRSRQNQRLRNHIAILHQIESQLEFRRHLDVDTVLRWYTSIASGLATAAPDSMMTSRLREVTAGINLPVARLRGAVTQIAKVHQSVLAEPIVPAFNSILARLLLRYHLGRHSLPPIMFEPVLHAEALKDETRILPLVVEGIENTLDDVIAEI